MTLPKIGFIGLGNVGASLAGNLLRSGADLTVRDLNPELVDKFVSMGAKRANSPKEMAEQVDVVITCLPSPAASAEVLEAADGDEARRHAARAGVQCRSCSSRSRHKVRSSGFGV
jgi:3-hydroxyisobutyrate dehydrogenase-like beta-hydroxyacid dehydrogenase